MARVRITIDDSVEFDGDLSEWIATPPSFFRDRLASNIRPEPWMKALMLSVTDAVMLDQAVDIVVCTKPLGVPNGTPISWTMAVDYVPLHE